MKKYKFILMFILIFLLGISIIVLPKFILSYNRDMSKNNADKANSINNVSSNTKTITEPEISDSEQEQENFDKNQMYFKDIEPLYKYLSYSQVETVKDYVESYVQNTLKSNVLDCSVKNVKNTNNNDDVSFTVQLIGANSFDVNITNIKCGETLSITITGSIH